jgi:hypothetical protein
LKPFGSYVSTLALNADLFEVMRTGCDEAGISAKVDRN